MNDGNIAPLPLTYTRLGGGGGAGPPPPPPPPRPPLHTDKHTQHTNTQLRPTLAYAEKSSNSMSQPKFKPPDCGMLTSIWELVVRRRPADNVV